MGHLFLSYSNEQAADALVLARGLVAAGAKVWCDLLDAIPAGTPFVTALEEAIASADAYLVLVPGRGLDGSYWVRQEVHYALRCARNNRALRVVPLLGSDTNPDELGILGNFEAVRVELERARRLDGSYFAELRRRIEGAAVAAPAPAPLCPYPGLEAIHDPKVFFGRDDELEGIMRRVGEVRASRRWLSIEGASGVGKSSLVHAGVVPRIRRDWTSSAPGRFWSTVTMRPGTHPLRALTTAIAQSDDLQAIAAQRARPFPSSADIYDRLVKPDGLRSTLDDLTSEGSGCILVIDQLEELITLSDAEEGKAFEEVLAEGLTDLDLRLFVVSSVRSDFLGAVSERPKIAGLLNEHGIRESLLGIRPEGLRRAIERPAAHAGLALDPGLVDLLLADARRIDEGDDADTAAPLPESALPLVACALRALYDAREDGRLTVGGYREVGGVEGALITLADRVRREIDEQQLAAFLLALVKVGRRQRDARRSATRAELVAALREALPENARDTAAAVVTDLAIHLAGGRRPGEGLALQARPRLVLARRPDPPGRADAGDSEDRFELVHDVLLFRWPWLKRRIDDERKELVRRADLESAALDWAASGRDPGWLPTAARLRYLDGSGRTTLLEAEMLATARDADRPPGTRATWAALFLMGMIAGAAVASGAWYRDSHSRVEHAEQLAQEATRHCPQLPVVVADGEFLCVGRHLEAEEKLRLCMLHGDKQCREKAKREALAAATESQCRSKLLPALCENALHDYLAVVAPVDDTEAGSGGASASPTADSDDAPPSLPTEQGTCLDECESMHADGGRERDQCVGLCLHPPGRFGCAMTGERVATRTGWFLLAVMVALAATRRAARTRARSRAGISPI